MVSQRRPRRRRGVGGGGGVGGWGGGRGALRDTEAEGGGERPNQATAGLHLRVSSQK